MGGGRAAALLSRSSSTSSALHPAVLSHHLGFRPLLSLRPFRGRAGASSVRMASDAAPQKDSAAAAVSSAGAPGSSSAASPSSTSPSSAVDFLTLCHRLKTTKRAGWVRHGIREPESVADHMYRMGVMALISSDLPGVDRERCIKMAIVHDIAEAKEIHDLWMEYEDNSSLEAKLVKDFDKVEMILQALEYETEQGMDLDEFFQSTADERMMEAQRYKREKSEQHGLVCAAVSIGYIFTPQASSRPMLEKHGRQRLSPEEKRKQSSRWMLSLNLYLLLTLHIASVTPRRP